MNTKHTSNKVVCYVLTKKTHCTFFLVTLAVLLCCSICIVEADAKSISAASASYTDVNSAVNAATSGDTVVVPAGSATWSSTLTVTKGITLQGAGIGRTTLTNGGVSQLIIYQPTYPALNEPFRITGFSFNGGSLGLLVRNQSTNNITKVRIDHNKFQNLSGRAILFQYFVYGVVDNNQFEDNGLDITVLGNDGNSWNQLPLNLGSADYVYVETNTFNYTGARAGWVFETGQGGRMVFRYNTITNFSWYDVFDAHGNQPPDGTRGTVGNEIYNNTLNLTHSSPRLLYQRAGANLMFNNTITGTNNPSISLTEEESWRTDCNGGNCWNPANTPYKDAVNSSFFWNNIKGNGTNITPNLQNPSTDATYIALNAQYWLPTYGADASKPGSCTDNSYYGATDTGKLYKCHPANTWTIEYTPYIYPHPLTGSNVTLIPPSNLRS